MTFSPAPAARQPCAGHQPLPGCRVDTGDPVAGARALPWGDLPGRVGPHNCGPLGGAVRFRRQGMGKAGRTGAGTSDLGCGGWPAVRSASIPTPFQRHPRSREQRPPSTHAAASERGWIQTPPRAQSPQSPALLHPSGAGRGWLTRGAQAGPPAPAGCCRSRAGQVQGGSGRAGNSPGMARGGQRRLRRGLGWKRSWRREQWVEEE